LTRRIQVARPELGEPEWTALREVIESGWVTQGPRVRRFEEVVTEACGAKYGVAVSSCTAALHLALVCAGVRHGDEVIVPSMSFIATANAVVHAGATPVFAEIEPHTFNLDLRDVERRIGPRTRAILLVHQLGLPADIDGFTALARAHGLELIEDAACAIGSRYHGLPIGGHSRLVCLSFHPRKLVTTGDGGMVLTPSADDAERLRRLRQHGMSVSDLSRHDATDIIREEYTEVGFNYRLTDIQAAVGIEQVKRLPDMLRKRQALAAHYNALLAGHPQVEAPYVPEEVSWNVQSYAVRLAGFDAARRDAVMRSMLNEGIATRPGVMTAHREPAYASRGALAPLPVSEAASDGSLMLPLHTGMSLGDCDFVADRLAKAVAA